MPRIPEYEACTIVELVTRRAGHCLSGEETAIAGHVFAKHKVLAVERSRRWLGWLEGLLKTQIRHLVSARGVYADLSQSDTITYPWLWIAGCALSTGRGDNASLGLRPFSRLDAPVYSCPLLNEAFFGEATDASRKCQRQNNGEADPGHCI